MISAAHALLVLAVNGPGSQPRPDLETTYHFEPLDDDRAVWRPSVDEAMLRQLGEAMQATAVEWQRAAEHEKSNPYLFYTGALGALRTPTTLIAEVESALDREAAAAADAAGRRVVWPPEVLRFENMLALGFQQLTFAVSAYHNDPKVRERRRGHMLAAIAATHRVYQHAEPRAGERLHALQMGSQLFVDLLLFCPGTELLNKFVTAHGGGLRGALRDMTSLCRQQFPIAAHACDLDLSLQIHEILVEEGHLNVEKAADHKKDWQVMLATMRQLGRGADADAFFDAKLRSRTPWVHSMQMPSTFNAKLATKEPRPFVDSAANRVAERLRASSEAIIAEYHAYEALVRNGGAAAIYDGDHPESWMTQEDGGGHWEYLYLRHGPTWDAELCGHMPAACAVARGLPEVDGHLRLRRGDCEGYCERGANLGTAGLVSFYRLGPNRSVKAHQGPSNQRIKCHLVVRAPPKGPKGASITAGGETLEVGAGDVFCFDDSYEHSVANGGGEGGDLSRVVFDITMWHPDLHPLIDDGSAADEPEEEEEEEFDDVDGASGGGAGGGGGEEAAGAAGFAPRGGGLSADFYREAERLFSPPFGTERMAPLLHSLVRFHRPEVVVELGYGYTTPFLARALADVAADLAAEQLPTSELRRAGLGQQRWYETVAPHFSPRLFVVDDSSQRGADGKAEEYARTMASVLSNLRLDGRVTLHSAMNLAQAHTLFEPDSLGLVWNDAQWDPDFIKAWWPLLKRDGGMLLLHNVIGNGERSRWCIASPRRVVRELFPGEKFEFLTLLEPHKAYQGSVAMLRRLDPAAQPRKYRFLWGGKGDDDDMKDVEMFDDWMTALDRR